MGKDVGRGKVEEKKKKRKEGRKDLCYKVGYFRHVIYLVMIICLIAVLQPQWL